MSHYQAPSAARTANFTTPDLGGGPPAKELCAVLDVTSVPGTDTVQLVIDQIDSQGRYAEVAKCSARVAVGKDVLRVVEGLTPLMPASAAATVLAQASAALTRYRARVVHSAGTSFTYSLSLSE